MKVTFQIEGASPVEIECNAGDNLLELARRANVAIDAPCSGNGSCGKCRVKLVKGELESLRTRHISDDEYEAGWRLACSSKVMGDCTVFVPDIASAYQSRMKTADLSSPEEVAIFDRAQRELQQSGIEFDNNFYAFTLEMEPPSEADTMPDNERLTWAIQAQLGDVAVDIPYAVMVQLAHTLREYNFHVTVKGEHRDDRFYCMEVCAPTDTDLVGCAIDIGTTTVSMVLADLKTGKILAKGSSGNGQIRFGADVINRIIEQGKPGGRKKLQDAIVKETLTPIIANLCKAAGISARSILRLSVGANTTMNHLLVGVDAQSVRMDPYIPSFFRWDGLKAGDLHLPANPLAEVVIAPNIGSYVGGDITAGTLSSLIWDKDEMSLFIDLGTNGEIVFGNRDFLMSCACSAGPAFEGGDISCGMRATDGAMEAVTLDTDTMEPTMSIVGDPGQKCVGICGSGIIDIISELFRCGIINAKGLFVREGSRVKRDAHGMGRFVLAFPEESETGREVSINEVDIDNFIRAKGAIYSAIDTLLKSVDMTADAIDHVYVAGGIGSGINMKNAVNIGMFPDVDLDKYQYIGNSSLSGAYAMVLSDQAIEKCAEVASNMTYMELSTHPGYMDAFVAACFIPHTDARLFPHSRQEV
ncbi:MAG: corrinoid activation/regeneration protein AcsV [Clostridiales bacterium]|nr:corrinoid activation/regeneration protein AcsV [Clostridiales bacterium]MDD7387311.1 corrinoid activation/regeneration protein AcsV [Bacillota bacterium]MDY6040940.1 corrinoid activation/regeneration protein AcsV [Candidatus Faecousia sp.]